MLISDKKLIIKKDVKMIKKFEQKSYKVSRYCPHQECDSFDCISDTTGIFTCSTHGWKFDIITNKCLKGDSRNSL